MSTPFQNRLVGTVIVAAVAIIFLPDILDGDKKTYQEQFEKIPAAPAIDFSPNNSEFPTSEVAKLPKETLTEETPLDAIEPEETASQAAPGNTPAESSQESSASSAKVAKQEAEQVIESLAAEKQPVAVKLPEKAIANQAWVIQLGSFRHQKNVDELVKKLKNSGYKAFTKPLKTKSGTLTKVFVGPELIKSSLEKKIPALKKLTNVEGKIARFSPVK